MELRSSFSTTGARSPRPRRAGHRRVAVPVALLSARASVAQTATMAGAPVASTPLPDKLSDADYWKLVLDMSEPGGYFRIPDNFTSNEMEVGRLFTMIRQQKISGGVYLGVGPEQN